jgi:hypothetical protein
VFAEQRSGQFPPLAGMVLTLSANHLFADILKIVLSAPL